MWSFSPCYIFLGDRYDWINTLLIALRTRSRISQGSFKRTFDRCGYLELRGHKGKIFMVLVGTKVRLCKNEQVSFFFKIPIFNFFISVAASQFLGHSPYKYPAIKQEAHLFDVCCQFEWLQTYKVKAIGNVIWIYCTVCTIVYNNTLYSCRSWSSCYIVLLSVVVVPYCKLWSAVLF